MADKKNTCGCGFDHDNKKDVKITANCKLPENFGLSDKPEPANIMIRPDRVKELRLDENGNVTVIVNDENSKPIEELNIEFENSEIAEKWIMDNFGKYLD